MINTYLNDPGMFIMTASVLLRPSRRFCAGGDTQMTHTCPTCGREYPPRITVRGIIRQRIVNALAEAADGLHRDQLMNLAYYDCPNGGPEFITLAGQYLANQQGAGPYGLPYQGRQRPRLKVSAAQSENRVFGHMVKTV